MKKLKSKWLLITAGLGSADFEASALRVASAARHFSILSKVVALDTKDVIDICIDVKRTYPKEFNANTRGFGFMAWKAEVVDKALNGKFGNFDGVIWVDGGCEVFPSVITESKFKSILSFAEKTGLFAFTLDTPEFKYTKKLLLDKYSEVPNVFDSPQIQTTWFALHGDVGRRISAEWLERTLETFANLDITDSPGGEHHGFIENRYDQSVFSLVCKKLGVEPATNFNVAGQNGLLSLMRASLYPIWASRNRFGESIIPKWMQSLGVLSLRIKYFFIKNSEAVHEKKS